MVPKVKEESTEADEVTCHVCGKPAKRKFESRWALTRILPLCNKHAEEHKEGLKKAEYEEIQWLS
jgi:hypothetical protein